MCVCLKMLCTPLYPMVLLIRQSRFEKWLAIIGNINPTVSDKPMCVCVSVFLCLCLMAVRNCQLCQGSVSWWCRRSRHPEKFMASQWHGQDQREHNKGTGKREHKSNLAELTWLHFGGISMDFNGFQRISTHIFSWEADFFQNTALALLRLRFCASQFICHRFSMLFRQFWRAAEVGTLQLGIFLGFKNLHPYFTSFNLHPCFFLVCSSQCSPGFMGVSHRYGYNQVDLPSGYLT